MNRVAAHRLGLPVSAACAPALMAARIEALLIPPSAPMMASRFGEPCISRRTSWKNDIREKRVMRPRDDASDDHECKLLSLCARKLTRCAGDAAIRCRAAARSIIARLASRPA